MIDQNWQRGEVVEAIFQNVLRNPMTAILVTINVAMFAVLTFTGGSNDPFNLYRWGAKFGPAIQAGDWHRLFLPIVLHSGFLHVAANTFALVLIGPRLEREVGWFAFLAIYVVSGVCGIAASYLVSPVLSVGASGAVFGIIGAYGSHLIRNRKEFGTSVNPLILNLAIVLAINILFGMFVPRIDQGAHVGGLIAGAAMGWMLCPKRIITIEDDFFIFGTPSVQTRVVMASRSRILAAAGAGLLIAATIAWWVSTNVDYDAASMGAYLVYEATTN